MPATSPKSCTGKALEGNHRRDARGLVPAALVARELDIRLVDTICVTSYDSGTVGGAQQKQGDVQVLKGVSAGRWLFADR